MARPRRPKRPLLIAAAAVLVLLAAGAAVFALTRPGDVSNPSVGFEADTPTPTPTATATPRSKRRADPADSFVWATYGYSKDRRHWLPDTDVRPPFKQLWSFSAHVLLEFPPAIGGKTLYQIDNSAIVRAIGKKRGRVRWQRRLGVLAASAPAYGHGRLYVTVLARANGQPGRVAALRARDGKVLWSRELPSRTESSPLLDQGRIYFGSENGTVFALRASDGRTAWTFKAAGAVKGALALWQGKLYFGDYAGAMYSIQRSNGHLVWRSGTSGSHFGLSSGQFYSTPAAAYGRVYIGNTDGNVYSFSAANGKLAWRRHTGAYVYSSPAVARVPGGRPAVYLGSYDGNFYAFDARSGDTLWTYRDGGTISGGTTVVGNVVYYSNNRLKHTIGLNARTGKRVWSFPKGAFNPVVSDGERIYLTGSTKLYGLRPKRR